MANLKNITELPIAESADGLNLIVNDNGAAKQIAASAIRGGIQPDWNQSDPTKPDYVKNRPFWDESKRNFYLNEIELDGFNFDGKDANIRNLSINLNEPIEPGKKYCVLWDGVEYPAKLWEIEGGWSLGHDYYNPDWNSNDDPIYKDEPFFGLPFGILLKVNGDKWFVNALVAQSDSLTHSVAIYQDEVAIRKIDPKFLPNSYILKLATDDFTELDNGNWEISADCSEMVKAIEAGMFVQIVIPKGVSDYESATLSPVLEWYTYEGVLWGDTWCIYFRFPNTPIPSFLHE